MDFTFLEVADEKLLEDVYAFRFKILQEIYPEYLKKARLNDKESDKYDSYAVHFVERSSEKSLEYL